MYDDLLLITITKKESAMTSEMLLEYLETAIFLPVLRAEPHKFDGPRDRLLRAQCGVIRTLRNLCHDGRGRSLADILADLHAPRLKRLWASLRALGFATPLDQPVRREITRRSRASHALSSAYRLAA